MISHGVFELHPGTHVTITGDLEVIDANKAYTHNIRISGYGPMDAEDWMQVYITLYDDDGGETQLWHWNTLYEICIDASITIPDGITSIADDMFKRSFNGTPFWDVGFGVDGRYSLCNSIASTANNTDKKGADVLNGYFGYPISTKDMLLLDYVKTINIGKDVVKIGDRAFKVSHYEDADFDDVNVVSNYATADYKELTDTEIRDTLNTLRQTYDTYESARKDYTVEFVYDYQRQKDLGNNKFLLTRLEPLLESINFADASKIEYIGNYAFGGQTRLTQLDFDEHTPVHIGFGAFKGCIYLDNLNFGEDIDVTPYMFEGCHSLRTFNKHNSIKSIGIDEHNNTCDAFTGCCSLDNLTFHPECDFGKVINYIIGHVHPLWCTNPSLPYRVGDEVRSFSEMYKNMELSPTFILYLTKTYGACILESPHVVALDMRNSTPEKFEVLSYFLKTYEVNPNWPGNGDAYQVVFLFDDSEGLTQTGQYVKGLTQEELSAEYTRIMINDGKVHKYERQITYIHGCNTGAVAHAWIGNDNRIIKYDEQYPGGVPMLVFVHGGRADIIKLSPMMWDLTDQGYKEYWEDTDAKVYPVKITGRIWWLNCKGSPGNSALLSVPGHSGSEFFKNNFSPDSRMQNHFGDD